jgi:dimethylargininase
MRALVRRPGPHLADGLVTHLERTPIDVGLATRQWHAYLETLGSHDWEIIEVPPADDCPDAVFIEDTVVMFDDLAVITHPGAPNRRAEVAAVQTMVAGLGYKVVQIEAPGTLDGGDVMKVGDVVYVGLGGRTNAEGINQLAAFVEPAGWHVVTVPVTNVLHLKSAVTALPDGTIVGWPSAVYDGVTFPKFLPTPEEHGAHVVALGETHILMAADCPSRPRCNSIGMASWSRSASAVPSSRGCVTCLSVRLRT